MVKLPPQAKRLDMYRLILYRKVSRLYMYYLFTKSYKPSPLLFPRVERADCPGPVIKKKKKKEKELHSKSGLWSTLLLNGQRSPNCPLIYKKAITRL